MLFARHVGTSNNPTIGPPLLIGLLETPVLVSYFLGVIVGYGPIGVSASPSASAPLIVFLGFLSLIVGFLVRDLGKSIPIFILSQLLAYSLSAILLFIYSPDLPLASVGAFIIGWCILVIIIGTLTVTVGSFIGDRLSERQDVVELAATWASSRSCPKCGARIFSRAKFCADCGNKLKE